MTLAPLLAAPPLVQLHVAAGLAAFGLGLGLLALRKGDRAHRRLGRVWAALLALVALSSFGITGRWGDGVWSWVHAISLAALLLLPLGLLHARRGQVVRHRRIMLGLFLGALVIAGGFTLMPGRLMARVVFG